jgi:hypothetical protein
VAIAHAFGLARDLDVNGTAEAFALVCCHYFHLFIFISSFALSVFIALTIVGPFHPRPFA